MSETKIAERWQQYYAGLARRWYSWRIHSDFRLCIEELSRAEAQVRQLRETLVKVQNLGLISAGQRIMVREALADTEPKP